MAGTLIMSVVGITTFIMTNVDSAGWRSISVTTCGHIVVKIPIWNESGKFVGELPILLGTRKQIQ